ncbi:MAG: UDP-N-acetylglucosamine 2-epimerase (non-hydrolyzing) [Planctomycetes bacterium]|nr:UDP-N-acetylglucosamine 2-epimerase (non-hydrolyzing) [Planctomycetota bacterium]
MFVFGTRPEAIKLAPVVRVFKEKSTEFEVKVCVTAQHREMLDQVLSFFQIVPDVDLDLMRPNQTLFDITASVVLGLKETFKSYSPEIVVVQGDTTTAFIAGLAAYFIGSQVVHVEAGLRSYDKRRPFPEEMNRRMLSQIADIHFCPTEKNRTNLLAEGIEKDVFVVGNSVIDALLWAVSLVESSEDFYRESLSCVDLKRRILLVTGHRRESFGKPFEEICFALKELASSFDDLQIVYPVHLNPNVQEPVRRILGNAQNVLLTDPLDYRHFVWLLSKCTLVLTDSGGIQEEAPALGKPTLVTREITERGEGVDAGCVRLVGTKTETIVNEVTQLLRSREQYDIMSRAKNPYGDGNTSSRILETLTRIGKERRS